MIQLVRRQKTGTSESAVSTTFNTKQCFRLVTILLWKVTSLRANRWKTNFKETWSIECFSNDWSNDLWIITDIFLHGIRFVHVALTQASMANAFCRAKLIKQFATVLTNYNLVLVAKDSFSNRWTFVLDETSNKVTSRKPDLTDVDEETLTKSNNSYTGCFLLSRTQLWKHTLQARIIMYSKVVDKFWTFRRKLSLIIEGNIVDQSKFQLGNEKLCVFPPELFQACDLLFENLIIVSPINRRELIKFMCNWWISKFSGNWVFKANFKSFKWRNWDLDSRFIFTCRIISRAVVYFHSIIKGLNL